MRMRLRRLCNLRICWKIVQQKESTVGGESDANFEPRCYRDWGIAKEYPEPPDVCEVSEERSLRISDALLEVRPCLTGCR